MNFPQYGHLSYKFNYNNTNWHANVDAQKSTIRQVSVDY